MQIKIRSSSVAPRTSAMTTVFSIVGFKSVSFQLNGAARWLVCCVYAYALKLANRIVSGRGRKESENSEFVFVLYPYLMINHFSS